MPRPTPAPMYRAPAELKRPEHLPIEHWDAIAAEQTRLHEAIESNDKSAIIGNLKMLVERISRVTLEVAGEPANKNNDYTKIQNRAHELLCKQPARDLTNNTPFSRITSAAKKMAGELGVIRNKFGTGHGRARVPKVQEEMVALSIGGAMIWAEWAVRRLGPFYAGRPERLIEDLDKGEVFYSGDLTERFATRIFPPWRATINLHWVGQWDDGVTAVGHSMCELTAWNPA